MEEGRGGAHGEVMAGREECRKDFMKEFGKNGEMASMKVILGSPIFLQKCSFILESKHLFLSLSFFLDKMLITMRHEAGPVSRQWDRRPGARSSITMSGLHIPDSRVEEKEV
ncbi:hypothetical protein I79_008585 [Cricetulus griseus]|uniref:Uncharacterized protein n=1 Tax=Cricetulus griseus TaxID=10029 RepID=G3HDK2_CRIGR|nr:hypothetical protein I79_008585 [Cricetulus griseus]